MEKRFISLFVLFVLTKGAFGQGETLLNVEFDSVQELVKWASDVNDICIRKDKGQSFWDLSGTAHDRKGIELEMPARANAISIRLKAMPGNGSYGIIGNKEVTEIQKSGWTVSTTSTGAWTFTVYDGKKDYTIYKAPEKTQNLRDGKWHELKIVFLKNEDLVELYFDQRQVAILNVSFIEDFGDTNLLIGNLQKDGYYVERNTFNGFIDHLAVYNHKTELPALLKKDEKERPENLKAMTFNIWNGGRGHGREVGVNRIIELIKEQNPDILGLQETYESGAIIADSLGYYYYLCNRNLSILSRYPIKKAWWFYRHKRCAASIIELPGGTEVLYCNTWLDYLPDYHTMIKEGKATSQKLVEGEKETRGMEINAILADLKEWMNGADKLPVIMGGDFNTPSHLDWIKANASDHSGLAVEWPTTVSMHNAGFTDAYRKLYAYSSGKNGITYSPIWKDAQYRIDYVYYLGRQLKPVSANVIDTHPLKFPSDHAALVVEFRMK